MSGRSLSADQSIMLIGASCRSAAESLHRLAIKVEAWDMFADRDTQSICEVHSFPSFESLDVTEILNRPAGYILPCGGLENCPEIWSQFSSRHCVLGPNVTQLAKLRDPFWLIDFCHRHACSLKLPDSRRKLEANMSSGKWLRKDLVSAGGLRIQAIDLAKLPTLGLSSSDYLQQWIDGEEWSFTVRCAIERPATLLAAMKPIPRTVGIESAPAYRYVGSSGPHAASDYMIQPVIDFASKLATQLALIGVLQMDCIVNDAGVWLLEINPRWTASMELAEDLNPGSILSFFCDQDGRSIDIGSTFTGNRRERSMGHERSTGHFEKHILYAAGSVKVSRELSDRMMDGCRWQSMDRVMEILKELSIANRAALQWNQLPTQGRLADIPQPDGTHDATIEKQHPICSALFWFEEGSNLERAAAS